MICRLWHGWTKARNADAYQSYLRDELYPCLDRELAEHGFRSLKRQRLWFQGLSR
jgi:hypothetical protein